MRISVSSQLIFVTLASLRVWLKQCNGAEEGMTPSVVTLGGRAVELQRGVLDAAVAVHLLQLQLVPEDQALAVRDRLLPQEHLADLHEGLVFGLWDHDVDVDGHREANGGEHQVAVRAEGLLMFGRLDGGKQRDNWLELAAAMFVLKNPQQTNKQTQSPFKGLGNLKLPTKDMA